MVRSTSLKGDLHNQRHPQPADECDDGDEDDEVFVTGHRSQGQVKSAMIVSAAGNNPYCTGSRDVGQTRCSLSLLQIFPPHHKIILIRPLSR